MEWLAIAIMVACGVSTPFLIAWTVKRSEQQLNDFFSEHASLFAQGQGWSLIIGFAQTLSGQQANSTKMHEESMRVLRKIPMDSPLWQSAPGLLLSEKPEAMANVPDSSFRDIFLKDLSLLCFERNIGGPKLMAAAIRRNSTGSRISTSKLKQHPGYIQYVKYALVNGVSKTFWPDNERPKTDEMLLGLIRKDPDIIGELPDLLIRIRRKYRIRYSDLLHPEMGELASLTCNLMADPPQKVSAVFGKKYVEVLCHLRQIPLADTISKPACSMHHIRPLIRHGRMACPVCFESANLVPGIRTIAGAIGIVPLAGKDEMLVPLELPLRLERITGLEEIRIGDLGEYLPEAIVDQTLTVAEHVAQPIPVQYLASRPLAASHHAMLNEWNHRAAT